MLALEMYLDAVFDANPEVKRPVGDRRGWGVAVCLCLAHQAPTFMEWCALAKVPMEMPDMNDDGMLDKPLPPGTVIEKIDGSREVLSTPEVSDAAAERRAREEFGAD